MVYTITVHLRANAEPQSVERLKAKLIEASRVYSQDKETLSWFVMQSVHDPRDFTIVERYEHESVSPPTHHTPRRVTRRNLSTSTDRALHLPLPPIQSQKYHLENPYWKTFDPYVKPLLEAPGMDLRRFEERTSGSLLAHAPRFDQKSRVLTLPEPTVDTSKDVVVPA